MYEDWIKTNRGLSGMKQGEYVKYYFLDYDKTHVHCYDLVDGIYHHDNKTYCVLSSIDEDGKEYKYWLYLIRTKWFNPSNQIIYFE